MLFVVVVSVYWLGEDGYLIDNKQHYVSPQESESNTAASTLFTTSPESDSDALFIDDTILARESPNASNNFSMMLPSSMKHLEM